MSILCNSLWNVQIQILVEYHLFSFCSSQFVKMIPFPMWIVVEEWRKYREICNLRQFSAFFYFSSKVTPQTPSTTNRAFEVTPQTPSTIAHYNALGIFGFHKKLGATILPPLSALYIMVKRKRPCTTLCLFKAHLPTVRLPGLIRTSTRIQPSLP